MAQKAAKATAKRNTEILKRTQLIALAVHGFYLLLRVLLFRRSFTKGAIIAYILLSLPSVIIQIFFERNSRPKYTGNELRSGGEDLEAKGLTEWMWDILYWTWICIGLAAVFGDWAWYLYLAVPVYSAYLAYTTFGNVRNMFSPGSAGAGSIEGGSGGSGSSKRQQKMEKRGGQQRVQYR